MIFSHHHFYNAHKGPGSSTLKSAANYIRCTVHSQQCIMPHCCCGNQVHMRGAMCSLRELFQSHFVVPTNEIHGDADGCMA